MKTILPSRAGVIPVRTIRPAEVLRLEDAVCIDLRSPAEFAEDHLPGAQNVPLFDDVERALVGTLYRQSSPEAAFHQGRAIARAKIARLVGEIASLGGLEVGTGELEVRVEEMTAGGIDGLSRSIACEPAVEWPRQPIVLNCWRGGLRSRSVAGLLSAIGLERVFLLDGGYKAYRAEIVQRIAAWTPPRPYVLCGWTGVGKTLVLAEIERLRPGWTVDLEALAGHRSSLLGMVGLEPRSQKAFESGLAARFGSGLADSWVVEGESRKVGDVILPQLLWRAMSEGIALEITAPLERRIEVLRRDYLGNDRNFRELLVRIPQVEERMRRPPGAPPLVDLLRDGRVEEVVRLLLDGYYDPLYRHSLGRRRLAGSFDATDPASAAGRIVEWIEGASRG